MRRAALVALVVVTVLLQLSLLPALRPFGVVPNMILGLITLIGLESTASLALIAAVAAGLALDLGSGASFGLWTGTLVLVALAAGFIHRAGVDLGSGIVAAVVMTGGTVVMSAVVLLGLVGSSTHWPWAALTIGIVMQVVLNLLLMLGLRVVVRLLVVQPASLGVERLGG